jgi:hypothetical protein
MVIETKNLTREAEASFSKTCKRFIKSGIIEVGGALIRKNSWLTFFFEKDVLIKQKIKQFRIFGTRDVTNLLIH